MIYFSQNTSTEIPIGTGVQFTNGQLEQHSNGECIGFIRDNYQLDGGLFQAQVYVAGGGGSDMLLGAAWDGSLTRFEIINGRVSPVSTGGVGWLLPQYPQVAKAVGETVLGALYK